MIESKEGHYIHLFPNPIYFFHVSTFFVDVYKHNILVLCFGQSNHMQFNTDKVVGGYHDLLSS